MLGNGWWSTLQCWYNRYLVGHVGKTAYERSRGKSFQMLDFELGETAVQKSTHCKPIGGIGQPLE